MKKLIKIVVLFFCIHGFAQVEGSYWYFGENAGVNFDKCTNEINAVIDGQSNSSESSASFSDNQGNLLFYTDGQTVWDRNHNPMPNAYEQTNNQLYGKGDVIILPSITNEDIYYIFAVDNASFWNIASFLPNNNDDDVNEGLTYSVIDMNLNGGLGDVIPSQKNQHLITYLETDPQQVDYKCSRKLTAVRGADCNSYWIITHFQASFYAFLFDANGVNPTPIITTVAPLVPLNDDIDYSFNSVGKLKSSPNGNKLAIAHNSFSDEDEFYNPGGIFVYDFDNETGIISNSETLYINQPRDYPYGVEFSPSGVWLYGTVSDRIVDNDDQSKLLRWNLQSSNIQGSLEVVSESDEVNYSAMQLSDNGIIYVAQAPFLNGIEQERYLGTISGSNSSNLLSVNFDEQGLLLDLNESFNNTSSVGLPQFNEQWFNTRVNIINNGVSSCELFLCGNEEETLNGLNISGANYTWYKDGQILTDETTFQLVIDQIGFYEVFIEPNDGRCPFEGSATVLASDDLPTANDASILQCDDDNDNITIFNLNEVSDIVTNGETNTEVRYYETFNNAQNETLPVSAIYTNTTNPQTIYAVVKDTNNGCVDIAEITLEVSSTSANNTILEDCDMDENDGLTTFNLSEANDAITNGLPDGLTITYYLTSENALLEINPLSTNFSNTIPYSQTIYARVENANECYGISEVQLTVFELPDVETEETFYYCLNTTPETITLTGGIINDIPNNYNYEWSTGATTSEIEVNEPGSYTVRVSNTNGCFRDRTITVLPSDIATFIDIEVTDATSNNSISIFVSGEGIYEYALDDPNGPYQESNIFENVSFGFHTVYVRDIENDCGTVEDIVSVIGFPKFFTPDGDTYNPFWQVKGISVDFQPNTKILIFDRYGKLLKQLDPLSIGWDGTYNGTDMPSSDYWYVVNLEDGRTLKGHFTLKR